MWSRATWGGLNGLTQRGDNVCERDLINNGP